VYWNVAEIWTSNSFQKICNELFIHHCHDWKEGSFLCETVRSFLTEYSSVWVETCCISSQSLLGFFHKISTRNYFWKMFQKRLALQGAPLSRFAKFCHTFYNFFSEFILRWKVPKTLTQVVSYVVCIQSRSQVLKENSEKDIRKKSQDDLFSEKQVLQFSLLSVWDLLRLITWVFRFEIFTRHSLLFVLRCGWDLRL